MGKDGREVFLREIWPSNEEIAEVEHSNVLPDMFKATYEAIARGNPLWNQLSVPSSTLYEWDPSSTYIKEPPYFERMSMCPPGPHEVKHAYCLLKFGDSVPSDHISPAGSIHKDSPAAQYLRDGIDRRDLNSYGSRPVNHEVMMRGTFANTRLTNKLLDEAGPRTIHIPSGEKLSVFDAAMGVKAIIAKSFETTHRSNLVGMGIIPLRFGVGEEAESLGLTGHERYTIDLPSTVREIRPGQEVLVTNDSGKSFTCGLQYDTEVELAYFDHGGILHYVIRKLVDAESAKTFNE